VLRGIFGIMREEINEEHYTHKSVKHINNDQVKEDEMGRACSTNGGDEECI
jgi:hypothetical protein